LADAAHQSWIATAYLLGGTGAMGPALAASGAPQEVLSNPIVLHQLPREVAAPVLRAYAESLTQVILCAAAVAAVGCLVALLLREGPPEGDPQQRP
jgi:hypothetical protein